MPTSPGPALAHALLLAALLGAPAAPARAADGFTEIGSPFPRREAGLPGDDADETVAEATPAADPESDPQDTPEGRAARHRAAAAAAAAAAEEDDWSAWWREWRGWSPFAAPRQAAAPADPDIPPSLRVGASARPPDPGTATPPFMPFFPLLAGPTPSPTPAAAPASPGTASGATSLFAGPPPPTPAPVIGEPTSMAILGGALAALGLLRRRRRPG